MTKPTQGLDLDALERDGDIPTPFTFTLSGRSWTCADPDEVDWQTAIDVDVTDARAVLGTYLGDADFAEFAKLKIPGWKVRKLLEAIDAHYNPGADQGEESGSPSS